MRSTRRTPIRARRRSSGATSAVTAPSLRRAAAAASFVALAATWLAVELLIVGDARAAGETLEVELEDASGAVVGSATLIGLPGGGVHVDATFDALPPGAHGFHIHETGACDAADGFKSAGGHLAGGREHGFLVEGGPHPGDMPNIHVPESGTLRVEVVAPLVTLDPAAADGRDDLTPLLDADGSALMIHSGADDYTSQPSGDAGERIACAVIGGAS